MKTKEPVETTSRLKVWYLTNFANFSLSRAYAKPVAGALGRVSYERRWILIAK